MPVTNSSLEGRQFPISALQVQVTLSLLVRIVRFALHLRGGLTHWCRLAENVLEFGKSASRNNCLMTMKPICFRTTYKQKLSQVVPEPTM